jgi:hypothetical protein
VDPLRRLALRFSAKARRKRAELFRNSFSIDKTTRILDIGSEDGSNIHNVLSGTAYEPSNIVVADVVERDVASGASAYGFRGVVLDESGSLPFADGAFDIVYCSSVIEHVTVPKSDVWACRDGPAFRDVAFRRQMDFAREIIRVGRGYFVQTPARGFPVESHTWLPMFGYLPRPALLAAMGLTNRIWIKAAEPDFNLLTPHEMQKLFPHARIELEIAFGFTKSVMAISPAPAIAG